MLTPLHALALLISLLIAASDLYARRVPNRWLLATLLLGATSLGLSWMMGTGGPPWPALLGLLLGLGVLLPVYLFGWMGAGDVKFFATLGFLLGAKALLPIWMVGSLLAGMHAAAVLVSRYWPHRAAPAWPTAPAWLAMSPLRQRIAAARQGRQGVPYAAYLAVGALVVVAAPNLLHG